MSGHMPRPPTKEPPLRDSNSTCRKIDTHALDTYAFVISALVGSMAMIMIQVFGSKLVKQKGPIIRAVHTQTEIQIGSRRTVLGGEQGQNISRSTASKTSRNRVLNQVGRNRTLPPRASPVSSPVAPQMSSPRSSPVLSPRSRSSKMDRHHSPLSPIRKSLLSNGTSPVSKPSNSTDRHSPLLREQSERTAYSAAWT